MSESIFPELFHSLVLISFCCDERMVDDVLGDLDDLRDAERGAAAGTLRSTETKVGELVLRTLVAENVETKSEQSFFCVAVKSLLLKGLQNSPIPFTNLM